MRLRLQSWFSHSDRNTMIASETPSKKEQDYFGVRPVHNYTVSFWF